MPERPPQMVQQPLFMLEDAEPSFKEVTREPDTSLQSATTEPIDNTPPSQTPIPLQNAGQVKAGGVFSVHEHTNPNNRPGDNYVWVGALGRWMRNDIEPPGIYD